MADLGHWALAMAAVLASGASLLVRDPRHRVIAMTIALVLAPALIAADNWDDERFRDLRSSPAAMIAVLAAGAALLALLTALIRRRRELFPLLAIAALPFRIPVESGGDSANLLLPLYAVIAAGVLAEWLSPSGGDPREGDAGRAVRVLPALLAGFPVLYAAQGIYSGDFTTAGDNIGFFFVPFAVLASLLWRVEWTPRLLTIALGVVVVEAVLFALVGFGQYLTRELFWNPAITQANELHAYFRVNSLFWDPNIFGRYLAVTIVAISAAMLWERAPTRAAMWGGIGILLLAAMAATLSQSSLIALLAGLAVLAALRWSALWTGLLCGAVLVAAITGLAIRGEFDASSEKSLNVQTSGRSELVRGGLELAEENPIAGRGSGSFEEEFSARFHTGEEAAAVVSHTEPVTVAAEQGAIGFLVYLAVLAVAVAALASGIRPFTPGLRSGGGADREGDGRVIAIARVATLAALVAMIVHSLSYAAFFTDPITWTLLAIGAALARRHR